MKVRKMRLLRHKRCHVSYLDIGWRRCEVDYTDDLAELIAHEYDHLDGILATMRAGGPKDLIMKKAL